MTPVPAEPKEVLRPHAEQEYQAELAQRLELRGSAGRPTGEGPAEQGGHPVVIALDDRRP